MQNLIAVVDDEEDLLNAVNIALIKAGFAVKTFTCGRDLFKFIQTNTPEVFILDIMLPEISGFDIFKQLRKIKKFEYSPIIFLSAKTDEFDKVLGLEFGADDYITKPFSPKELAARVKAVLRRIINAEERACSDRGICVNKENLTVTVDGKPVELTLTEFKILDMLHGKKGTVFSRDKILDYVWGEDKIVIDRTIDVHIKHLREKLGKYGKCVKNIRSIGYKFEEIQYKL